MKKLFIFPVVFLLILLSGAAFAAVNIDELYSDKQSGYRFLRWPQDSLVIDFGTIVMDEAELRENPIRLSKKYLGR